MILTATDIETGEVQTFTNQGVDRVEITPMHVLASGSLPPGFPMTRIKNLITGMAAYLKIPRSPPL